MVNHLRKKFVFVSTSLMIVVLGLLIAANSLYNKYWNDIEISGMLDWIARSGVFTLSGQTTEEKLMLEMLEEKRPIIGIILDEDGNVISTRAIGDESKSEIELNKKVLDKMLEKGNTKIKTGGYYYSYNVISPNRILIVAMDDHFQGSILMWGMGMLALGLISVMLLIGITFWLSRFVTEPAEQSLLREKRFISDASHELKTPLGAISINAQALELDNPDNIYLKNILSESERMSRLIERLLTLSKLDEAEKLNFEEVSLSDICEEMALTYETIAYEKKVYFSYEIDLALLINGNSDEIRQLLVILIDNAFKNVDANGSVELLCKKAEDRVRLCIANTGHGIEEDELEHIFDRFYTTDKARTNSFGLGLAIAKAIVERHGGVIEAYSEIDKKTEFTVCFNF